MNKENAIEVRNMTKYFKVEYDKAHTLKERLLSFGKSNREVHTVLKNINLDIKKGETVCLIGTNGSGKSTLLKTIYRQLKPDSGQIFLDGKSLDQVSLKETAKEMAVVTQFNTLQFDCTVEEIVMLGRTPHLSFLQKESERDHLLVQDALDKVGMSEKKARYYSSLSGGEKQRVILARALAQEPKLLLLDEPTNHLDIKYQLEMLALVKELGINVLAVLHDIQLACRFSDYIYLMKGGEIVAQGVPRDAVTPQSLQAVYDVQSRITWTDDQQAMIQYL